MDCKIYCSFGELIDKITILKIKEKKATDDNQLQNIKKELLLIQKDNILCNTNDSLFNELYNINNKLWILEDLIREKSKKKQFDLDYIKYAESIHITNDERYSIKKKINIKYNSNIIEEKIYKRNDIIDNINDNINENDIKRLDKGKKLYTNGNYNESLQIIKNIMLKYENYNNYNGFYVDLLFAYSNIYCMFNITFPYLDKIFYIMENINKLLIPEIQKEYCKTQFTSLCLSIKDYFKSYNYINYINDITGPNINKNNMSFFTKNDVNKILLIYEGGGLGDIIMFSRFIPKLCEKYNKNKIKFLVLDKLIWLFTNIFSYINNLEIISFNNTQCLGEFNYHCSLLSLIKHLKYDYNTIYFTPLLKNIKLNKSEISNKILNKINNNNKTYILNWKGNPKNTHEKNNRCMKLVNAIPLFKKKDINWIVVTQNIDDKEKKILNKYNVSYYGNIIDKNKAFYDTISIMKNINGVISTDTSLVHLSANLDVPTYVLLTLGCEWRWTRDKTTNWYPKVKLFRQTEIYKWDNVINNLLKVI